MGFGDYNDAARFRTVVEKIARKVVQSERPGERVGRVYSVTEEDQSALILFPGETIDDLVKVRCAINMTPTRYMESTFEEEGYQAVGDVVRVAGRPGAYYILDFVSGNPAASDAVPVDNFNFGGNRGVNLADPVLGQDAATKNYVDGKVAQSTSAQEFTFSEPSLTWTIPHNLNQLPVTVNLVNNYGQQLFSNITYPNANTAVVTFGRPNVGKATVTR